MSVELGPKNPNPGSDEARGLGCICAVLDNNRGRSAPWPPHGWWITEGCPVHDPESLNCKPSSPGGAA